MKYRNILLNLRRKRARKTNNLKTLKTLQEKGSANAALKKKIGLAGEYHVYDYEVAYLKEMEENDLAKLVVKQFEDESSFPGYDIKSFNLDGEEFFIEVKSSTSLKNNFRNYFK